MSPRNDTYLALCLAQAKLSPLHYRHGSIIVRGGKVIGQGFNCYRPGFDGGALKTGTLAQSTLDGAAISDLKKRLKSKHKSDIKPNSKNQQGSGSFTPFEFTGLGHNSNACLSMHSEMMAIQSALSLSSGALSGQTSARGAKYFEKPCFSLQADSKKRRLRAKGLKAYAKAVSKDNDNKSKLKNKKNITANTWKGTEKHSAAKHMDEEVYQHQKQEPNANKSSSKPQSCTSSDDDLNVSASEPSRALKNRPNSKSSKLKNINALPQHTSPQPLLVTKNKSLNYKPSVASRTKDLRLKGSDIYVARLGSANVVPLFPEEPFKSTTVPTSTTPPHSSKQQSASLYDELSLLSRTPSCPNPENLVTQPPKCRPEVRASRPCYRCVSAMHAVGIKRVFWTTQEGEWEGAKVRDLVEALEMGEEGGWNGDEMGQVDRGVFVTKHEVLLLRRLEGF